MRSKVTVVLLFLNVALFFYIFYFERQWITERGLLQSIRRVLPPEVTSMDSFTRISRTGERVKLEKREEKWFIAQPFDWPANPNAVSRIHNELQYLEHETAFPVADLEKGGQSLADYGLADPAMRLEFTAAGKTYELLIGDVTEVGNRLYVLSPDKSRIHVVGRSLAESLALPLTDLRDNNAIFTIPVFEVRSLNIQTASNLKVRLRRDTSSRWGFESPILARASKVVVEVTINALNSLSARNFIEGADADLDRTGLNSPRFRITLEGNARRETLLIGNPAPATGESYAKIDDKNVVFTTAIPPQLIEVLRSSQETLRDAHVLDFEPATVTAVTISSPGQPELALQKLESAPTAPAPTAGTATDGTETPAAASPASPGWQVVTRVIGQAPVTVAGDPGVIGNLLQKLQQLSARETTLPDGQFKRGFLTDAPTAEDLERYGFNRPEREVTVNLNTGGGPSGKDPSSQTLQIGVSPDEPGKAFARLTNPSFVYEILPDILDETPALALHYRQRQLRDLPENARITSLALVDLSTNTTLYSQKLNEGDRTWDAAIAAEPEAFRPVLSGMLAQLRKLRAQAFVAETFSSERAETPQGPRPWRYRLDYAIAFGGNDASPGTPSSLLLTERLGGANQLGGTADFGGVVFNLTQEMIDALFPLTYSKPNDPGAPAPAAGDTPAAPAGATPSPSPAPSAPPASATPPPKG